MERKYLDSRSGSNLMKYLMFTNCMKEGFFQSVQWIYPYMEIRRNEFKKIKIILVRMQIVWKVIFQNLTIFRRPNYFLPLQWNVPYTKQSRMTIKELVYFTHFQLDQKINIKNKLKSSKKVFRDVWNQISPCWST